MSPTRARPLATRAWILTAAFLGVALAAAPANAAAPEQTLTVINTAGVPRQQVLKAEQAVTVQSMELHHWWGTPIVNFGPGGWRITLVHGFQMQKNGYNGYHDFAGVPFAVVSTHVWPSWTWTFSHEVMEMLVDPGGTVLGSYAYEVCDPVNTSIYSIRRVAVAAFVTPAYFDATKPGPKAVGTGTGSYQ